MGWPRQPLGRQLFLCAASTLSPSSKMMAALGAEPQLRAWRKPLRPDQAALGDLVLRIPWQELDPSPEAGLVVTPGPSRVPGIINALATDVAAVDDASAAFLPHFPDQAVLERLARLDPAAEQVPVLLAVGLAGAENDQPGPGEASTAPVLSRRW